MGQFRLDGLDAGEIGGEFSGERTGEVVVGDADGLVDVAQGILGKDAVFGLAED